MRRRFVLPLGILMLAGLPSMAHAQGDSCELLPGARLFSRMATGDGRATSFISGPARFVCTGGVTVESDSAVWTSGLERERIELLGDVLYRDSVKTLTADRLIYQRTLDRLYAYGNVVLTDSAGNAVIRGPVLEHQGVRSGTGEVTRTIVTGGANARIWPADSTGEAGADDSGATVAAPESGDAARSPPDTARAGPLDVDADRIEIIGRDRFRATGDVVMTRDSIRGYAEESHFQRASGRLVLLDSARVVGSEYDLAAARIEATLLDDRLDDVVATGHAVLVSGDTRANAHRIHTFVENGQVQRMVAWHGDSASAELRASIRTPEIRLIGDSIQVLAPGRTLDRVVAVGRAYAERLGGDSAIAALPGLPEAARRDWVQGDTIIGTFEKDSTAAAERDTLSEPQLELQRIVAIGGSAPARSIYRMQMAEGSADRPQINYVVADRITIRLEHGRIVALEAVGPVQGIQLRPGTGSPEGGPGGARSSAVARLPGTVESVAGSGSSER